MTWQVMLITRRPLLPHRAGPPIRQTHPARGPARIQLSA